MYKDKDKQRQADRARQQRRRDKIKVKGAPNEGVTQGVTTEDIISMTFGNPTIQLDCECMHCQSKRVNNSKNVINHGAYKTQYELGEHEINRVSLPGDTDFQGISSTLTACS